MTRSTDKAVLNNDNATNNAKNKINALDMYVPHYTPSLEKPYNLMNQITKKAPTKLHDPEKTVFMKEVNTRNFWTFEIGTREGINVPIWIYVVFQQSDRQHDQKMNNDTFVTLPITSTQCIISYDKYPDVGLLLNYDNDDYSQVYGQIKEVSKVLTKDNILQSYLTEVDFRSPTVGDDGIENGHNIHAFDMRYQKSFQSGKSVKVEFKLDNVVPAGIYGYALVLTNRLVSISSDGQRMFDFT